MFDRLINSVLLIGLEASEYIAELEFFCGIWSRKSEHHNFSGEGPSRSEEILGLMACRRGVALHRIT
jgi:hypothetical protein